MSAPRPHGDSAQIFALERYLNWATVMRRHFDTSHAPDELMAHWQPYMAAWYGLLYVVVEGWEALGLSDPEIDQLLSDERKALLRRYRNGVFHYQRDYFDERFVNLWAQDFEARFWILRVHDAFARWIPEWNESYGRWLDSRNDPRKEGPQE